MEKNKIMKKLSLIILTILISLTSYGQEYQTSIKLDSMVWNKINEFRVSKDAYLKGPGQPEAIKIFELGAMRDFCYEVTYRNTSKGFDVSGHTSKDELAKKIGVGYGECLYKLRTTIGVDLSDEKTLDELSTDIVNSWINSWSHKIVLRYGPNTASTVTSLVHIGDDGRTHINVTLHTRN